MSAEWLRFLSALESRGRTFENVKLASDRRAVIVAAGFADPLDIAVLETEWTARVPHELQLMQANHTPQSHTPTAFLRSSVPRAILPSSPDSARIIDPVHLSAAPEELQDAVLSEELLMMLLGFSGSYAVAQPDGRYALTTHVPPGMQGMMKSMVRYANALNVVRRAASSECNGRSLVEMAMGEVLVEISQCYIEQISRLQRTARANGMLLVRLASEIHRIGYPILRLQQLLSETGDAKTGAKLLHRLHTHCTRCSGCPDDEELAELVLRRTAAPYLGMLGRWMREGVLNDPYKEFFVEFNEKHSEELDAWARWKKRFTLRKDDIPEFLKVDKMDRLALLAGKYCYLLKECGQWDPSSDANGRQDQRSEIKWGDLDELHTIILHEYESASRRVIDLLLKKRDLLGVLNSMKHYFLQDRGDWVTDFLDAADDLLRKSPNQVKLHTIKGLLQSAIAKNCGRDPYHSKITCRFSDQTLPEFVKRTVLQDSQKHPPLDPRASTGTVKVEAVHCIELLQLDVEYEWPTTLVVNAFFIQTMNCIFRLLLWCRTCERMLTASWFDVHEAPAQALRLRHEMLHFLRQFQFYAANFVLEPQWELMLEKMCAARSVSDINIATNTFFRESYKGLILSSRFSCFAQMLDCIQKFAFTGGPRCQLPVEARAQAVQKLREHFTKRLAELASPGGPDYAALVQLLTWCDFSRYYERKNVYRVAHGSVAESQILEPLADTASSVGTTEAEEEGVQ